MKHNKRQTPAETAAETREEILDSEAVSQGEAAQPASAEELLGQLTQAEQQRDEYLQMAQRVQADFDNFRRRNNSVRSEAFEDGAAAFIKTILPVLDNLERALAVESSDQSLCSGVQLVQKQLLEALEKRGVTPIDRMGEPFDPKLEDAVVQGTPEEGEPGTVAQVLLKGYRMGDNVLRHAMVKVIVG